jgi:hypothetical protein
MAVSTNAPPRGQWNYAAAFTTTQTMDILRTIPRLDLYAFNYCLRPSLEGIVAAPAGMWLLEGGPLSKWCDHPPRRKQQSRLEGWAITDTPSNNRVGLFRLLELCCSETLPRSMIAITENG